MITLRKQFTFEASHLLPYHDGKCQRLHGHSWKMRVVVQGDLIPVHGPKAGMLMDYAEISAIVKPIVEQYLDHHHLNETTKLENPTSEALSMWLYHMIKPEMPLLVSVEVDETCTSSCCFEP